MCVVIIYMNFSLILNYRVWVMLSSRIRDEGHKKKCANFYEVHHILKLVIKLKIYLGSIIFHGRRPRSCAPDADVRVSGVDDLLFGLIDVFLDAFAHLARLEGHFAR